MRDWTLKRFTAELARRTPAPGGGAAAAVTGAIGAATGAMALAYTGSPGEGEYDIETARAGLDRIREALLELAGRDRDAYGAYVEARKLPKGDAREKAARREALAGALERSLAVPLEGTGLCLEALRALEKVAGRTNPHLVTDVAVGAQCLAAALRGLWYNVAVNLKSLKDESRSAALLEARSRSEGEAARLAVRIELETDRVLREG